MRFCFRDVFARHMNGELPEVPLMDRLKGHKCMVRYAYSILKRKPGLFFRILAAGKTGSHPRFRSVTLVVDYACNLKCPHCNVSRVGVNRDKRLNLDQYRKLHADLKVKYGNLGYAFTGGEPLLHERLFQLLEALEPEKHMMLINTNATLIDDEMAARLLAAGADVLNISIDEMHSRAEQHGGIDFDSMAGLCRIIRTHSLIPQFNCVVTSESLNNGTFDKVVNFCLDHEVLLIGNLPIPLGSWHRRLDLVLSEDEARCLREIEFRTPYFRTDHKSNIHKRGCPAFHEKIYITPDGEVLGCTFLQFSLGNLNDHSIETILAHAHTMPYFKDYPAVCPPAEDRDFIESYMQALERGGNLPIHLLPMGDVKEPWRELTIANKSRS